LETEHEKVSNSTVMPRLVLGNLVLEDVKAVYNNTAIAPAKEGMDFNHLDFSYLNLELADFKMENDEFTGSMESAKIREKSGLDIQEFRTDFVYESQQAYLKNLYLQTPKTVLQDEIVLNYTSIDQLSDDLGNV